MDTNQDRENVRVLVRCRPVLNSLEKKSCVEVDVERGCIMVSGREFYYDAVFGPDSNNEQLYMKSVRTLVDSTFAGYNCTCFLYGQTGTGKTFTHGGLTDSAFAHFFTLIRSSNTETKFLLRACYYELYNEDIRDLLDKSKSSKPLELRESEAQGVYVKDLSCHLVNNLNDLRKLKTIGDKRRATAATKMNQQSSRSHSIFSITLETVEGGSVRVGRLNLVDLAGSERQSKSESKGLRLKEASRINLSLTSLSLVIRSLTDPKSSYIPYRNSKLTRLLSGSLGGNSKTLLIACISPADSSSDETLNTLRFASRAKRVENKAKINEDERDALLREYRRQVEELRRSLRERADLIQDDEQTLKLVASQNRRGSSERELVQQLEFLKAKIMVGGENLLEKAEMHEKLLEASRAELEEKKASQAKLKAELEAKQATVEKMNQTRDTMEGQLANLDEKLRRALVLYKQSKEELKDLTSEHQELKESLLQSIRATSKEISYADCIIENFIPRNYLDLINNHAHYDEQSGEWQIKYIALSGNNIAHTRQLTDRYGQAWPESSTDDQTEQETECNPFLRLRDLGTQVP